MGVCEGSGVGFLEVSVPNQDMMDGYGRAQGGCRGEAGGGFAAGGGLLVGWWRQRSWVREGCLVFDSEEECVLCVRNLFVLLLSRSWRQC